MGTAPAEALSTTEQISSNSPQPAPDVCSTESIEKEALIQSLRQAVAVTTESVESVLKAVAAAALVLTNAKGTAVALRQNGRIVCRARSGEMAPELGATIDPDSGISGECVRAAAILMCHDTLTDKRVEAEVCRKMGVRSIVAVPLRGEIGMVGVLEAFSERPNAFDSDALNALRALSEITEAAYARERGELWHSVPFSRKTRVRPAQIVVDDVIGNEYSSSPSGRVWIIATVAMALLTFSVAWWSWHHSNDEIESATQAAQPATSVAVPSDKEPVRVLTPKPTPAMPLPDFGKGLDHTRVKKLLRSTAQVQAAQIGSEAVGRSPLAQTSAVGISSEGRGTN
jgi:hypothetical protein